MAVGWAVGVSFGTPTGGLLQGGDRCDSSSNHLDQDTKRHTMSADRHRGIRREKQKRAKDMKRESKRQIAQAVEAAKTASPQAATAA